jgi:hypothetical protein
MSENGNPKTSDQPWPETYPAWLIEILEHTMAETGMSREEAEAFLNFELMFGGTLMQGYVAKLKAHEKETKKPETSR